MAINREFLYPNIDELGYTYCRIENMFYVPHVHMNMECTCVLEGSLRMTVNDRRYNLKSGDIILVTPYQRHSIVTPDSSVIFGFALYPDNLVPQNSVFGEMCTLQSPVLRRDQYSPQVRTLIDMLLSADTPTESATHVGILNAILGYLRQAAVPRRLANADSLSVENRVLLYLHENAFKPITLLQASEELGISQFKLSRICNQEIGIGFNTYLKSVRISAAMRRLAFTDMPISEIARSIGFESLRTFNRAFEETGCTPRAYRASHRERTVTGLNSLMTGA